MLLATWVSTMMLPNMLATALVCLIDFFLYFLGSLRGLWQWSGRKYSTRCRTLQDLRQPARRWRRWWYEDVWRRFAKKILLTVPDSSDIDISASPFVIQVYKTSASWRPRREKIERDIIKNKMRMQPVNSHHELPTRSLSQRGNVRFLRFQNISSTASPSFQQRFYAVQSKYCTFHDYLQNSIEHINAPSSRCDHLWANEHEYFICAETALGTINEDLLDWRLASKDVSSLNKT